MSELRTYDVIMTPSSDGSWVLKYEADKVIARQKYKRCLAMAKWCKNQRILCYMSIILHRYDFYVKWHKRWLELAEKFKPNMEK